MQPDSHVMRERSYFMSQSHLQQSPLLAKGKPQGPRRSQWKVVLALFILLCSIIIICVSLIGPYLGKALLVTTSSTEIVPTPTPTFTSPPPPFDPSVGAVLPTHRIIAFYAVPGAEPTGPAYILNETMFNHLKAQGNAYLQLDPTHPIDLGIDLVVSVPDSFPGPAGHYSHHVDSQTIQAYIDFCNAHELLLFLDLNFGQAPVMREIDFFLSYLQQYSFVHLAMGPEC